MHLSPLAVADKQPLRELLRYHQQKALPWNIKGRALEFDINFSKDGGGDFIGQLSGMGGGKAVWETVMAER